MAKKQDNYYFLSLIKLADFSLLAAKLLQEIVTSYNSSNLDSEVSKMHEIEHRADLEKHKVIEKLAKEFITPIEREDIISIAQKIDDVTDAIEDVLLKLYMYNVQEIKQEAIEFSDVICQCCLELNKTLINFYNFKKSTTIKNSIIEINRLEEVGDKIYTESIRKLFIESKDPIHLMIWEEMFFRLEKCCDYCEVVADEIESVVMKNS